MISNINSSRAPSFSTVSTTRYAHRCVFIGNRQMQRPNSIIIISQSNSNGHTQISGIIKVLEKTIKRVGNISSGIYLWNNDDGDEDDHKIPPCIGFGGGNDDDGLGIDFTIIGMIILLAIFLILLRREKECYE